MGILESKLQQLNASKTNIENKIQKSTVMPTASEKKAINDIVNNISVDFTEDISSNGLDNEVTNKIISAVSEKCNGLDVSFEEKKRIEKVITNSIVGLGPLEEFMQDDDVTEVMVLRWNHIVIEKNGIKITTKASFQDENHLQTVIQRIVQPIGRQINLSTPIVDARLADGSRVNATIPPVSVDGATLTIRKFSNKAMTGEDYLALGAMSEDMLEFLRAAVRGKCNIIVSGGTNTGKTTLLNMLSSAIPESEMIVTIEDSCELKLKLPNIRRLEAREVFGASEKVMPIDIKALVKNSLRMNPDRIVVGEIRDGTIVDMISAMSTGHEGSMSTAHANSPSNLVNTRIPIFYSMSDTNFSSETQALQISEALDLIIQIGFRNKKRVITNITCVNGVNAKNQVELQDLFVYSNNNEFISCGYKPSSILRKLKRNGITVDKALFISPNGDSQEIQKGG